MTIPGGTTTQNKKEYKSLSFIKTRGFILFFYYNQKIRYWVIRNEICL